VVLQMLANVQQRTIQPIIQATVAQGTLVYIDEYDIYARAGDLGLRAQDRLPQAG
jgi:transposase